MADYHYVTDGLHPVPYVRERVENRVHPDFRPYNPNVNVIKPPGDGGNGLRLLIVVGKPSPILFQPARQFPSQPLQIATADDLKPLELLLYRSPRAEQYGSPPSVGPPAPSRLYDGRSGVP